IWKDPFIGIFPFSGGRGAVPGTPPGVLSSGDPGRLLAGTRTPVSCLGSGGIQYLIFQQGPQNQGRRQDPGSWRQEPEAGAGTRKLDTSARSMGHQTSLSVVLRCTSARCERICSLIGDVCPGEWTKIFDPMQTRGRHASMGMCLVCSCTLDSDDFFSFIKMRRCPHGGDWSELAANGESGNVCIKGDAFSHTPNTCAASDFSLHFLRLSSSMNRVEECMGQDPRILRGRILARLRITGMRSFNKTRRPKLRILMLDSAGLACASWACISCNGLSFRSSCRMFVLVPGDNLVDSWYRSRSLGHVGYNRCWDDLASCFHETRRALGMLFQNLKIHPSETHGSWMRFFINWRLYGLSSGNPEAGWTFVKELGGWMDYRPRTRRLDGLSSWSPEAGTRWLCGPSRGPSRIFFDSKSPPSGRSSLMARSVFPYQNLGASSNALSSYNWGDLKTEPYVLGSLHIVFLRRALVGWSSLPLIARFRHRTLGITCALKSTRVAYSEQASLRQDITPVILRSRVLLRPEPHSEPGRGPLPLFQTGVWRY
ncbi:LOW QUALITY PROTEIN: hypothetical protein HID58_067004, partial [Brassica napus]